MNFITLEQYKKDEKAGKHDSRYLLDHLALIGRIYDIKEVIIDDKYTLTVMDNKVKNELIADIECHVDARLDVGFAFLESFYESYKEPVTLNLVE